MFYQRINFTPRRFRGQFWWLPEEQSPSPNKCWYQMLQDWCCILTHVIAATLWIFRVQLYGFIRAYFSFVKMFIYRTLVTQQYYLYLHGKQSQTLKLKVTTGILKITLQKLVRVVSIIAKRANQLHHVRLETLTKICRETPNLVRIRQKCRTIYTKT